MKKPAREMIDLHDITLCAADSAFVGHTARALRVSQSGCRFGDAILFSDAPVEGPFRTVRINRLASVDDYSRFCLREMVEHIRTPFALVIQWDGFVVNPQAWANVFRKYDYIGAAWHGQFAEEVPLVGNGGFSLRSRKLLKAVSQLPLVSKFWEDRLICHIHREQLERQFGIRFAPVKVADRFSYQYRIPETLPFGFHGVEHLWRHAEPEGIGALVEQMDVNQTNPGGTMLLIQNLAANNDIETARVLYRRFRVRFPPRSIIKVRETVIGTAAAVEEVRALEWLLSGEPREPKAPSA